MGRIRKAISAAVKLEALSYAAEHSDDEDDALVTSVTTSATDSTDTDDD
jgi:hypothetical protein